MPVDSAQLENQKVSCCILILMVVLVPFTDLVDTNLICYLPELLLV